MVRCVLKEKSYPALDRQAQAAIILRVEEIEKLRAATRRTSQLAHQLLALSRDDARSLQAQSPERVDLHDLCEALLEPFLDAATAKCLDSCCDVVRA